MEPVLYICLPNKRSILNICEYRIGGATNNAKTRRDLFSNNPSIRKVFLSVCPPFVRDLWTWAHIGRLVCFGSHNQQFQPFDPRNPKIFAHQQGSGTTRLSVTSLADDTTTLVELRLILCREGSSEAEPSTALLRQRF